MSAALAPLGPRRSSLRGIWRRRPRDLPTGHAGQIQRMNADAEQRAARRTRERWEAMVPGGRNALGRRSAVAAAARPAIPLRPARRSPARHRLRARRQSRPNGLHGLLRIGRRHLPGGNRRRPAPDRWLWKASSSYAAPTSSTNRPALRSTWPSTAAFGPPSTNQVVPGSPAGWRIGSFPAVTGSASPAAPTTETPRIRRTRPARLPPPHARNPLSACCEPFFEILEVRREPFGATPDTDFTAWVTVMRARL